MENTTLSTVGAGALDKKFRSLCPEIMSRLEKNELVELAMKVKFLPKGEQSLVDQRGYDFECAISMPRKMSAKKSGCLFIYRDGLFPKEEVD